MTHLNAKKLNMRQTAGLICFSLAVLSLLTCLIISATAFFGSQRTSVLYRLDAADDMTAIAPIEPVPLTRWINTADISDLELLPGIGPALAQAIDEERASHGAFHYPEDLMAVSGIGQKKIRTIIDQFIVP